MTVRKKPDNGSSLRWKGRLGRPRGKMSLLIRPLVTIHIPAIVPSKEAIAASEKPTATMNLWLRLNIASAAVNKNRNTEKEVKLIGEMLNSLGSL